MFLFLISPHLDTNHMDGIMHDRLCYFCVYPHWVYLNLRNNIWLRLCAVAELAMLSKTMAKISILLTWIPSHCNKWSLIMKLRSIWRHFTYLFWLEGPTQGCPGNGAQMDACIANSPLCWGSDNSFPWNHDNITDTLAHSSLQESKWMVVCKQGCVHSLLSKGRPSANALDFAAHERDNGLRRQKVEQKSIMLYIYIN